MLLSALSKALVKQTSPRLPILASPIPGTRYFGMGDATIPGPVQSAVTVKLRQELKPMHLDVINESYMHNVPKGTESHFKVIVVSEQFEGKPLVQRHRLVHSVLHEELESGAVHALGIVAKTPQQWEKSQEVRESPKCMGGSQN